jgi:hypothetical protein
MGENKIEPWSAEREIEDELENLMDCFDDILVEAEIEEPAGRGAGFALHFDHEELKKYIIEFADKYAQLRELM